MGRRTIHKPEAPVFWFVVKGDKIHIGTTETNQRTDTGMGDLVTADSLDELITKLTPHKRLLPERPRAYISRRTSTDENEPKPKDADFTSAQRRAELIPDMIYNDRGAIKAPKRRQRS